jgi:hypothetical protein
MGTLVDRLGLIAGVVIMILTIPSGAAQLSNGLIISEFLPDPTGGLESEWIEIVNLSAETIDLSRIKIGDRLSLQAISDLALDLPAGEYCILVQDAARFREFYPSIGCAIVQPSKWPILNNDGDIVRLADFTGAVFDSVVYAAGFSGNRSWERYISGSGESFWGESYAPTGSTPCDRNRFVYPRPKGPDPLSPDGDGFEDETILRYDTPDAESFDLSVYDIAGRQVRKFISAGPAIPGEIIWDGRDDAGRKLPLGIYIIYARASGGRSIDCKKTVVIAR